MRKEGLQGAAGPGHTSLGGTGSLAQEVVGGQGGPAGGNSPQGPGTAALGDGGVLPRWCLVLKEGL